MFKVLNKDVRATSLTSFCWIYCQLCTYSTPYSSVYVINFKQVNVCLKPVLWHSICTRAEQDHPSTVVSVNFEHMPPRSSVFTVDFEHVFIFRV